MTRAHPAATARPAAVALAVVTGLGALAGCTDDEPSASPTEASTSTQPTETPTPTATDDVTASPYGCYLHARSERVPPELSNLSYPANTVIHEVEVRGDSGVLLTGVTDLRFRAAVGQMRQQYSDPPFEIVGEEDVEDEGKAANWTGPSVSGRWVITDISAACPGNTEVKVLWTSAGGSIG